MAMDPFPPQAYTRETLVKAYQWLQHQPPHVKQLASTPDLLIGLYLKSRLGGGGPELNERPSIQNFKSELKSLAGMMGEFETTPAPADSVPTVMPPPPMPQAPIHTAPPPAQNHGQATQVQNHIHVHHTSAPNPPAPAAPNPNAMTTKSFELDYRSLQMLQQARDEFNLSSESEALRMLISLGHRRMRESL